MSNHIMSNDIDALKLLDSPLNKIIDTNLIFNFKKFIQIYSHEK
jgi:hypothetical protein